MVEPRAHRPWGDGAAGPIRPWWLAMGGEHDIRVYPYLAYMLVQFNRLMLHILTVECGACGNSVLKLAESKGVLKGGGFKPPPKFSEFFLKSEGKEIERKRKKKGCWGGGVTS